ncbi:LysR family transcriptional regulator [Arthrobacter sp. NtRootA1]|uniref:LysR family transcriptional regulator n=1 Tax=Arthrobacter sp. NtRootA1 TaxID=2830983 RepID=UPI001CC36BE1|nr:LysR family transcriptional regulator [Arthrobacter sp. NtRootA1]BCW04172.1 LysR family transcriptional regulator [Arthrobacter sp. NtRootA1]
MNKIDGMDVEVRQLRCLLAVVEEGTFTDAAIGLGMSQAAVSRNISGLEQVLGVRLLERTTRSVGLTRSGERVVAKARRVLSLLGDLEREARSGTGKIRIGYAWSALGEHTMEFQRRWAVAIPGVELQLLHSNSPTGGLAEGTTDFAILRRLPDAAGVEHVRIGEEKRYCAMSSDDPLATRRSVTMAQVAQRPVAMDLRTGSTTLELWAQEERPDIVPINDVDDWLTTIGSGAARGMTAASTAHQYRRRGIIYRPVRDAPSVSVYLAWSTKDPPQERGRIVELLIGLYSG